MMETKKQYRARMRSEQGPDWWKSPGPRASGVRAEEAEDYYVKTRSGRPKMAPLPSYDLWKTLKYAKGWPKPGPRTDMDEAREMEGRAGPRRPVVYMHYEWVWALVLVPLGVTGKRWRAYSVDPQEREGSIRWAFGEQTQQAPVFAVKDFPTKAALFKALRALKGNFALGK